ncbi:MAG TPA: FecR domain-containing protein [Steroidobacteraceae bacterium]|jgi:transmembrane sensor
MSDIVKLRTRAEIDEEAAEWTWRLDGDKVGPADREAFDSWLRQDARHRRAFDEFSKVWRALDGLGEAKRGEKLATFTRPARHATVQVRRRWWLGAAAAVLIGTLAGVLWMREGSDIQTFSTAVGQQRDVTLADGSVVSLNTNSIIETDLSRRLRQIHLRKGEAHFQVAHDRSRPFLVHAGDAVVRAVGTQFEVRLLADQHVDIVVNEGRVEVQATPGSGPEVGPASGPRPATTLRAVRAGERLSTASADYSVRQVTPEQLSSELAWRDGAIIFDGEPLSEAITEIERYTDTRIVVSDAGTAALRVGGRFRTDDVQDFFRGLESALPITVRHAADGVIYIESRH